MFDVITIIAAIVFIVLVLQLRAMLAMPFLKQSARLVGGDWSGLLAAEDVIAKAGADLAALGFSGPHWLSIASEPVEAGNVRAIACYRRASDGVLAFLVPLFFSETPNRCISYWVTRLADGRTLVSQPSDPFFALTASDAEPAQTLAPAPLAAQLQAHLAFVARHGQPAANATDDAVLVDIAGAWMNQRRERLLARGAIALGADGIARPRLGFAVRALRAFWSRQKWPANSEPVPAARLVLIAQAATRVRERAPTAGMQWLLFALSVALFMAVGAVVFGAQFALILLVVIAIHEAGHYFAMRAFGYRNVQMLALPLVGGVTVGHEAHPRATHRAWMSMMGPLPGIVIGWVLLVAAMAGGGSEWLMQAAFAFLAVNYLNVVPVPPLDGGHIVQAMLPARWYGLRIAFLVLACVIGAGVSAVLGLVGLAIIVLLQLGQVPSLLQNRLAIKQVLAQGGVPVEALRARKLRVALDALERVAGPTPRAQARIHQAEDIVRSLDVVPMSWPSRLLTGGVYGVLMLAPAAILVVLMVVGASIGEGLPSEAELAAADAARAELEQRAEKLSDAELRDALGDDYVEDDPEFDLRAQWVAQQEGERAERELEERRARAFSELAAADTATQVASFERPAWWMRLFLSVPDWPPGAADADIAAAEQRLDEDLPAELREFYRLHDGFPMLQLGPVAELRAVPEPHADVAEDAITALETPFAVIDHDGDRGIALRLGPDDLRACHAISPALSPDVARYMAWPSLLWCPRLESASASIVSTDTRRAYRDFAVYLRDRAAQQRASRP
jgi:Zn-dependent protease